MPVDPQQGLAVRALDDFVKLPNFLEKSTGHATPEESSFLKKRTKKLLRPGTAHDRGHGRDVAAAPDLKVFCFFSSEKKAFLPLPYFCA
jgi:hypothetical protein